jgi:hypothetical protein
MIVTHPFAESRVEFWRKEYRRGISEVYYWRTQGLGTAKLIKRCAPVMKPQGSVTDDIGKILEIIGHWRGLIKYILTE